MRVANAFAHVLYVTLCAHHLLLILLIRRGYFSQMWFPTLLETAHFIFCNSFQNLRLVTIKCMWSDAVLVCTKKISLITKPMRCTMVRCDQCCCHHASDAVHLVRCFCCSCLYKKDRSDYKPMRCGECDAMRCDAVHVRCDAVRCGAVRCMCMCM